MVTEQTHDNTVYDTIHFINRISSLQAIQGNKNSTMAVMSTSNKGRITPEQLAKQLNIPYEMAKKALLATTQQGVRFSSEPTLTRKYRTNDRMLRYQRLLCDLFMDTMFAAKDATSIRGFKSCQVFATEFGHIFVVPMENKSGKIFILSNKTLFQRKRGSRSSDM